MRIVVIGDVGGPTDYHAGDEAMLAVNLAILHRFHPGTEFTIVSQDPAWSATQYNAGAIARIGFGQAPEERLAEVTRNAEHWAREGGLPADALGRQAIERIAAADALWISGGGNLRSTWPEHIWERAALLRIAGCFSKPALVTGQTLGPEFNARERELLGELLPRAAFVGVRERPSLGQALSLGVPLERLHYQLDDAVFMTPKPVALEWDSGQPWIAVTLAPFEGSLEAMARELANVAGATGAQLVFVPHVNAPPEHSHRSDQAFAERIAGELAKLSTPARVLQVFTAEEIYWLTGQASMVISSRYHPVVFGLAWGRPALGVYTDEYTRIKIRGALAHAGRAEQWSIPLHVGLAGGLSRKALELWSERQAARTYLASLHETWKQQEQERWSCLLGALKGNPAANGENARRAGKEFGEYLAGLQVAHRQAEEEVALLRPMLAARDEELGSIQTVLAAREEELNSLRPVIAAKDEEIGSLRAVLVTREKELASLRPVVAAKEEELGSIRAVLADREEELASLRPVVAARDEELGSVKTVLAAKEEELLSIKPVLAARDEELDTVKTVLAAKETELESIKPVFAAHEEELARQSDRIAILEEEVRSLRETLERQRSVLAEKEQELEQRRRSRFFRG
jgi:polysaccharide pyruvyl transferase WcaK-like protein